MLSKWFKFKKTQTPTPLPSKTGMSKAELSALSEFFGVSEDDIKSVLNGNQTTDKLKVGSLLLRSGLISERDYLQKISDLLKVPIIDPLAKEDIPRLDIKPDLLKELKALPLERKDTRLDVAMADPRDMLAIEILQKLTNEKIRPLLATEDRILEAINRFYEGKKSQVDEIISSINGVEVVEDNIEQLKDLASEAPIIRLVNLLINRAVEKGASDIHIEPFEREVKIRFRIDGVLHEVRVCLNQLCQPLCPELKSWPSWILLKRGCRKMGVFSYG